MSDFILKDQETLFQGRLFALKRLHMQAPDGRAASFDLVSHPGAVAILPVDGEGNICFVEQYRPGAGKTLLEIPAGTLTPGEDPTECARREMREEIGKFPGQLAKLGEFFLAPGYSSEYLHIFLASNLVDAPLTPDADEFIHVVPIPIDRAYEMARQGEFHDGKTLAALMLALPHLSGAS